MWNLDKKPRSAARLGFWLAPRAEQGEQCRGQHRAPLCPPVIISFRSWAYLIFAPSDLALAHRGLHKEHPRTTESPGCSQTQAVCFHLSLRGQAQSQGVPWEKGVWKSFFFHFFFSFFFSFPPNTFPFTLGFLAWSMVGTRTHQMPPGKCFCLFVCFGLFLVFISTLLKILAPDLSPWFFRKQLWRLQTNPRVCLFWALQWRERQKIMN